MWYVSAYGWFITQNKHMVIGNFPLGWCSRNTIKWLELVQPAATVLGGNVRQLRQWKAMEGNGRQWKAVEGNGGQWRAMEGNARQWEAMGGNGRQWKAM